MGCMLDIFNRHVFFPHYSDLEQGRVFVHPHSDVEKLSVKKIFFRIKEENKDYISLKKNPLKH